MELWKHKYFILSVAVIVVFIISVFLLIFFLGTSTEIDTGKPTLIIDHDGGADDAMAIFMALLYEKYYNGPKVIALTTIHGNVNEPQVYNNTQRILTIADRLDVPIYRGSRNALVKDVESDYYFGKDGLGDNANGEFKHKAAEDENAALALIQLSKKYEDLSILAIGALTNIALAIKLDNEFTNRLSQLYVAAGNIYSDNYPDPEFNALIDVEAYHIVTAKANPRKLTIIPFSQILNDIHISNEWRLEVLGAIPTKIMRAQNSFEQVSIPKSKYWVLLDPAAMTVVLNRTSIVTETKYSNNSIHLCGTDRGINTNFFTSEQNATTRVVYKVQEGTYKEFLFDLFSAELRS